MALQWMPTMLSCVRHKSFLCMYETQECISAHTFKFGRNLREGFTACRRYDSQREYEIIFTRFRKLRVEFQMTLTYNNET